MHRFRLTLALGLLAATGARAAAADRLLGGRVDQIVPTRAGLALLRDAEVIVVDGDGRLLGRCAFDEPVAAASARGRDRRDGLDAEDFLRASGFAADDESPEAEAVLDAEGLLPARRAARAAPEPTIPRHIAAAPAGDALWIATSRGLRRTRPDGTGCARAAFDDRDVSLVAAAGQAVAAVADTTVWRSDDGGRTFAVAGALPFTARALALADGGAALLVAGEDGVFQVGRRQLERVLERPVDSLAACAGTTLAFGDDGTYAWTAGARPDAAAGPRPPVRRLACSDGVRAGPRWVATGVGLWTSADGVTWTEEPAGLGYSVAAAARVGDRWWLATGDGLVVVAARAGPPSMAASTTIDRQPPPRGSARARWAALLPRVTVAAGGWRDAIGKAEWHTWLLVTIPLGRRPPGGRRGAGSTGGDVERRRAALAAEAGRLAAPATGQRRGDDDDEREALLRATLDELEALP